MQATVHGTVFGDETVDQFGFFGPGFALGDTLTLSFRYDTEQGFLSSGPTGQGLFNNGSENPVGPVTIDVDGVTYTFAHTHGGLGILGGDVASLYADDTIDRIITYSLASSSLPFTLDTPFDLTGSGTGFFKHQDGLVTLVRFSVDRVIVQAAVPEPASWALLILGFGTAGALLRRKGAWA